MTCGHVIQVSLETMMETMLQIRLEIMLETMHEIMLEIRLEIKLKIRLETMLEIKPEIAVPVLRGVPLPRGGSPLVPGLSQTKVCDPPVWLCPVIPTPGGKYTS